MAAKGTKRGTVSELEQAQDSQVREADLRRFTEGDCHYLARAINKRTGWPIMAFCFGKSPDLHAFVRMPDGRALDVQGPCEMKAFKKRWQAGRVAEFDWRTLRKNFLSPQFGDYTYRRAAVMADRILARIPEGGR